MANRQFSEQLNKELDNINAPSLRSERVEVLVKLLKVSKFQADAFLDGLIIPEPKLLNLLAEEFEVSIEWLLGKSEQRK